MKNWFFRTGLALIAFETASGIFLLATKHLGPTGMGALLFHLSLGFFLWVSFAALLARHLTFRRTIRSRRFDLLGFGTAGALFVSAFSGSVLVFSGVSGQKAIWVIHLVGSAIAVTGITAYVISIVGYLRKKAKAPAKRAMSKGIRSTALKIAAVAAAVCAIAWSTGLSFKKPEWAVKQAYTFAFGNQQPFYPSHIHTDHDSFVHPDRLTKSRSCGTTGCHVDIVKQWEQSAHRLTPNPFVEASMRGLLDEAQAGKLFAGWKGKHAELLRASKPGMASLRQCTACHAPAALLAGKVDPSRSLESLREYEGNSCLLCHSITRLDRTDRSPGRRDLGFLVSEPVTYPFQDATNPLGKFVNEALIRAKPQTHRDAFMKPFFRESHYCASCHDQALFRSWEYSKFGPQSDPWHHEKNRECQACHMPQVDAKEDISARSKGTVADHRFLSAGLSLAKLYSHDEQFVKTQEFLANKKLAVEIIPSRGASGSIRFGVRVANIGVGHLFPSGPEADLIESWPEVKIKDDTGKVVYSYGTLDAEGNLDEHATQIYRNIPFDRKGRELAMNQHASWKFSYFQMNAIPPMTYDEIPFNVSLPRGARARNLTIDVTLKFRKPSQRYADFVFGKGKFIVPVAELAHDTVPVDQLPKRSAEALKGLQPRTKKDYLENHELDLETQILYDHAEKLQHDGDPSGAQEVLAALSRSAPGNELEHFKEAFPSEDELLQEDLVARPRVPGTCFVNTKAEDPKRATEFLKRISGIWDPLVQPTGEYNKSAFLFSSRKKYIATLYEPGPSNKDFVPYWRVCVSKPFGPERGRLAGFRLVETVGYRVGMSFAAKFDEGEKLLLTDRYYDWWAEANSLNAVPTVVSRRAIRAYVKRN